MQHGSRYIEILHNAQFFSRTARPQLSSLGDLLIMKLVHSLLLLAVTLSLNTAHAEVRLPALFTEHMVLQQKQKNRVWGWAGPAEVVTVSIGGQTKQSKADESGSWSLKLDPIDAGGPHQFTVKGKANQITFNDVLIGEVWICSGQSNMGMTVNGCNNPELEKLAANYPNIRLMNVPRVGTQTPQDDIKTKWEKCSPQTVGNFSAAGYYFGRDIHNVTGIPVGLINDSWGGSSAEAWVRRDLLEKDEKYKPLMDRWRKTEATYDYEKAKENYKVQIKKWQENNKQALKDGKPQPRKPRYPQNSLTGQHRPGNLYNGMMKPVFGYGIRGAIWYQGESNAGRAYQYRDLFPLMIQNWRDEWGQGDFPFYWVQLADFLPEVPTPGESSWAELREAQTMTMSRLPKTGEAVIIDVGEGDDIHPRDKQTVGHRLARWALAKEYGYKIDFQSPTYKSHEVKGGKVILTFDSVDSQLWTFDTKSVKGFAIAGEDKKFVNADAKIIGKNQILVSSADVKNPVSVRYAWANNPVCNVHDKTSRLPLNPFRTDDWPGITINNK